MPWRSDIHDRVLNAKSLEDIQRAYRDWARDYDRDLVEEAGYVAPRQCADALRELLPASGATVLDAGCGTGLVGGYLAGTGIAAIDGVDCSPEMLELAASRGCYRNLMQADLNAPLDIASNQYSATVCVGTFTSGHVGPKALFELIRVTSADGPLVFTVRDGFWEESGFQSVVEEAVERGLAALVARTQMPYIRKEGSTCQQVVMRAR